MIPASLRRHVLALVVAVPVALVYGGSHVIHLARLGFDAYEPMTIAATLESAGANFPRARTVYEGEITLGDLDLAEYENSPAHLPMLTPFVMGGFGRLVGSMKGAAIVSDFLFPAVAFLLFYLFMMQFTNRTGVSVVAATLLIFAFGIPFWEWRQWIKPPIVSFPFRRIDFPKVTYLFYLPAALFTYLALQQNRRLLIGVAGLFAGSLFYTDLYDWVTFFTALLFLFAFFLVARKHDAARAAAGVIAVALIVAIPYWLNLYALTQLPQYQDIATRVGVERSHGIRFYTWGLYLRVTLFAAVAYLVFRRRNTITAAYLVAFPLTLFVTLNLQMLTGLNPQPDHWVRPLVPFVYPTLAAVAIVIYDCGLRRIPSRVRVGAVVVFIAMFFAVEIFYVFRSARLNAMNHSVPHDRSGSYRWIQDHIPNGAVIASVSPATNLDIQLYTNNKLFLPFGLNTIAPTEEIWQRFGYLVKLYGVPLGRVRDWFAGREEIPVFDPRLNRQAMTVYLFQNAFYSAELNSYFKGSTREVPGVLVEEKIARYMLDDIGPPPYRLDYVYYGPNERILGQDPAQRFPRLRTVYEDAHVRVYRFH